MFKENRSKGKIDGKRGEEKRKKRRKKKEWRIAVVFTINKICAGENTSTDTSEEPQELQDKESARFCSACGEKFMGNDRYCIKCGNNRKRDNQEIATESVKRSRTKSLDQLIQENGKAWVF